MSRWVFRGSPKGAFPSWWAEELEISPTLLKVLWRRGMTDLQQLKSYLEPRARNLTPPARWPGISEAADILAKELLAGKRLAIWGDYDVDGITATALVLDVLEEHGFNASHHLPDRRSEGYGLNVEGIETLAAEGCQTLLTVDCGISDVAEVARARELGMRVVISDHHLPPAELPDATSIINPRMDGDWPCVHLAGVGVAFYLMAALNAILAPMTGRRYKMDKALDLVALGTLADVMTLEGENRILASAGLARMKAPERPGLAALKKVSNCEFSAPISSLQAVFRLAPRINAAGRMGNANLALGLLRARDQEEAERLALQLDQCNRQRKSEEENAHRAARRQARELLEKKNYAGLALFGQEWHPGIVGIVASRIVEEFNRPAIVLCEDKGALKGSGRSVPDFDLHSGLASISDCLLGFGGHRQAAGVRLEKDSLEAFRDAFDKCVRASLGGYPAEPTLLLEDELDFSQASDMDFLRDLDLMQPFGPGNAEPVFSSPPLLVKKRAFLGASGQHVLLSLRDDRSGISLQAKAWRMADKIPQSIEGRRIQIAYAPKLESFRGMLTVDLGLKDWRELKS